MNEIKGLGGVLCVMETWGRRSTAYPLSPRAQQMRGVWITPAQVLICASIGEEKAFCVRTLGVTKNLLRRGFHSSLVWFLLPKHVHTRKMLKQL